MKKIISLVVALAIALIGVLAMTLPASAHQGDLKVTGKCVDADTMTATYDAGWTQGTSSGKLYKRAGIHGESGNAGSSTAGWTYVKDVSGAQGRATFTVTHEKSEFSGTNKKDGPWYSSKVIFSDNYGVAADSRIEGFDWSKCESHDWTYEVNCTGVSGSRPNTDSVDSNIRIKNLDTGEVRQFNYHGPDNGPSGPFHYTLANYGVPSSWTYIEIQWVQVNGTNYHWEGKVVCGNPKPEVIVPQVPTPKDVCGKLGDRYGIPDGPVGVTYSRDDNKAIIAEIEGNKVWGVLPAGWVKVNDTVARYDYNRALFTDEPCGTQPEPEVRYVPGSIESCELGGVATWRDKFITNWSYDAEQEKWVRDAESEAVQVGYNFTPYTEDEKIEKGCISLIEIPANPESTDVCGAAARWTIPESTEAIEWALDDDGDLIASLVVQDRSVLFTDKTTAHNFGQPAETVPGDCVVITEPPVTEPPVTEPPVTEPPTTEPPITEPPVTEPPTTAPPTTQPPVTQPPSNTPPSATPKLPNTGAPLTPWETAGLLGLALALLAAGGTALWASRNRGQHQ